MNQLSLLPTKRPGDALADPSRSSPAQAALNATARASDAPQGASAAQGGLGDNTPPYAATAPHDATAALLTTLRAWSDQGWLRRIDSALPHLLAELEPQASATLLVSAALLAQVEGRGHTCLDLAAVVDPAQASTVLDWPPAALASVQQVWQLLPTTLAQWRDALCASGLVRVVDGENGATGADASGANTSYTSYTSYTPDTPDTPDQGQPLVLAGTAAAPLLYLRRYWLQEQQLAQAVVQRATHPTPVDEALARQWLDRLFDAPSPSHAMAPSAPSAPSALAPSAAADSAKRANKTATMDWQKLACALALRARLTIITGGPGTGKTYTAARLLALLFATAPQAQNLRVALAAPTGKAAARLRQSIDSALQELGARLASGPAQVGDSQPNAALMPQATQANPASHGAALDLAAFAQRMGAARTLHALLGARPGTRQFRFNASAPLDVDIVIVDEASMVNLELMAALLQALPPSARLILLGDKDQLASVEAGAVLGDLCQGAGAGQYDAATARYAQALTGCSLAPAFLARGVDGADALHPGTTDTIDTTDAHPASKTIPTYKPQPAGAASALAQQTVMLRQSRRFGGKLGQLALAVNAGDATAALALLQDGPAAVLHQSPEPHLGAVLRLAVQGRAGAPACYADYLRLVLAGPDAMQLGGPQAAPTAVTARQTLPLVHADPHAAHSAWATAVLRAFDRFRLVCAVHEGDWGTRNLNLAVQHALSEAGLLKARGEWFVGRPAMVTRNDAELGVFNGDVGITLPPPDPAAALRVYFLDGDTLRSVASSRLPHVETAFAITVHKCQGSEFLHTALVLPGADARVLTRELVYTGITRARECFTLLQAQPGALAAAIARPSQRASGLARQLAQALA
jgi:exodeoxyribonuclease V alpha subunit